MGDEDRAGGRGAVRTCGGLEEGKCSEAGRDTSAHPRKAGRGLCLDLVPMSFPALSRGVRSFLARDFTAGSQRDALGFLRLFPQRFLRTQETQHTFPFASFIPSSPNNCRIARSEVPQAADRHPSSFSPPPFLILGAIGAADPGFAKLPVYDILG